jgi:hypothetical protein
MSQITEKTYQMLWDCKYCRQRKNLGLTHRHCPSCGAPQDTTSRYFPPEEEKVAVEDHPFVGADVLCPACGFASSRAAKCCGNCGSPLGGAKDVGLVQAPVVATPPAPAKSKAPFGIILAVLLGSLIVCTGTCAFITHKRGGSFEVKSAHWERTVAVERLDMKRDSAWCDQVPSDGRVVGRHAEQRSTKQVPDGQTCSKTKKDQGNGTYKEITECKPKYKSEPVTDQMCDYEAPRWIASRTEKAEGESGPLSWPKVALKSGTTMGSEREGAKNEKYTITFAEPKTGKTSSCDFPEPKWSAFKIGARYDGKIGAVTGSIDCDSLVAKP